MKEAIRLLGTLAAEAAAELLWPTRCAVCDEEGSTLCKPCRDALPYIDSCRACPRCGAPFGSIQCSECNPVMLKASLHESLPFDQAASAVIFNDDTKLIVSAYKDQGERRLAKDIATIMARYASPSWTVKRPLVSYVPATKAAISRRGFDHTELLAKELATELGLESAGLLTQPKSIDQRKLSRRHRQANMESKFRMIPGATAPHSVILIDDVCTTGSTLYAASGALRQGGAQNIYCLTFARV